MFRKLSIIFLASGLVLFQGCSSSKADVQSAPPDKPNVLFIVIDDLNDWIGALNGHPGMEIHTPNLDKFAESSLLFTNAHTPSPACAPARVAIMTGVHPSHSGLMRNVGGDGPSWREREALRDVETLEQFFGNRGYTTLGGGKIYHTLEPQRTTNSQVEPENWDFYFPSPYINLPHQIRAPVTPDDIFLSTWPEGRPEWHTIGPIPVEDKKMSDYHIVEWASHELSRLHEKPFFLAAGIFRPHSPWEVPQKFFDMYPIEDVVLPEIKENDLEDKVDHGRRYVHEWVLENDQWENIVQAYAASVTFADAMIGRLLDAFEQSRHADNTIVVLWSDHGMHIGEKENYEKFTLWELSTRVPFMMKVPGVTRPGSRSDQPVSLLDIYPTLAQVLGYEIPSHVQGNSLIPLLENPDIESPPVVTSYNFRENVGVGHAVRSQDYRYIYYTGIGLEELYDHRTDPNEWENIAYRAENEDVVRQHRQVLLELIPELVWSEEDPEGYRIENGSAKKIDFISLTEEL